MILEKRIPYKYLLEQIKYDMLGVFVMSTFTFGLKFYYGEYLPKIPIALPAFLGTAISLLLSFKLSQSYERWWEARKIWGAIVNDSRTLVMQVTQFTATTSITEHQLDLAKKISYRQIAWAHCLGQSLRNQDTLQKTNEFIEQRDLDYIQKHDNRPLALIDLHYEDLAKMHKRAEINDFQQMQIGSTLVRLCDAMGKAERINGTVFPVTYRQILRLFIIIFLFVMSFALLEVDSKWEIPLDMIIALPFFMIEKTSFFMQDPFTNQPTDTSVTAIAITIEKNIKQLWDDPEIPSSNMDENSFYVL